MAIDIRQFLPVFFEESFERLEAMESGLLRLAEEAVEEEVIHTLFRAAHSIKGGSDTFGFHELTALTHVLEYVLEEVRGGTRPVTAQLVELLLQAVDCSRDMLVALRDGAEIDQPRVSSLQGRLAVLSQTPPEQSPTPQKAIVTLGQNGSALAGPAGCQITFRTYAYMLMSGNDPGRIFRELETLGTLTVCVDTTRLPAFAVLDPESCYLAWELTLQGDISRDQVSEVFAWVEGDCELLLSPLPSPQSAVPDSAAAAPGH